MALSQVLHSDSMEFKEWLGKAIDLDENWKMETYDCFDDPLYIEAKISYVGPYSCPVCGGKCTRYDTRSRTWRDLNFGSAKMNIIASFPRVKCREHGIREIVPEWAGKVSRLTARFEQLCLEYSCAMPVSLASKLLDVDDNTIWKIVKHYSDQFMRNLDLTDLRALCIDETQCRKGHNYITVVTRPDTGQVIFATQGRDVTAMAELSVWLIHHGCDPKTIETISCDMGKSYLKGASFFFPNAEVVIDSFHVIQAANKMVDDVRKKTGFKGKDGKRIRFKLLTNEEDLTEEGHGLVDPIIENYADIGAAYMIKEAMRDFYGERDESHAPVYLRHIISSAVNMGVKAITDFGEMLERHFNGIVAWHRTDISNGVAEGNNSVIQAMKACARGYANTENLISMIYLRNSRKVGNRAIAPLSGGI